MIVGIYARVSTQEQAKEGYSIDEQISRLKDYCKGMDWKIYDTYVDAGISGATMDRPSLQRMLDAVKAGKIKKVVVYKLDRLSRSQLDTLKIIEEMLLAHGCDFVSMSENFDTGSPFGKAMIGILAVFAQLEREQIKERMSMGMLARAKEGLPHGGIRIPFGYVYRNGKLEVNESEASQLRLMFQWYVDGKTPKAIAEMLNERGFSSKEGTSWWETSVRRILRSRSCLGYIHYKGEWYKGEHDAIIDEDLFRKAEAIAEQKSRAYHETNLRSGKTTSLLGGLLFCSRCGAKYHKKINPHGTSYVCYSRSRKNKSMIKADFCNNKIWNMEKLDAIILDEIRKLAIDPSALNAIIPEDTKEPLLAEIDKITEKMSKLMDLYSMSQIPVELLNEKIEALAERKEKMEHSLAESSAMPKEEALFYIESFGAAIDRGNDEELRTIVVGLIERIELDGDDITIHWNFN